METKNKRFDIVAIAASAGGLAAISHVLSALPANFSAAIVIVQHLDPRYISQMAVILGRRTAMMVKQAEQGEPVREGIVYVAPPDNHLLIETDGTVCLSHTDPIRFLRPSADLLFKSVADSYKERALAIVLTGTGSDGSLGVTAIKESGGTVIVEDSTTAEFSGMPEAAYRTGHVDFVLPLSEIGPKLIELVN
jgi:two-component system, chemotaxis family, protein-glutamate methylesterase/glutaminase